MIRAVNNIKELILEQKFAEGQMDDEVAVWGEEIEDRLAESDEPQVAQAKLAYVIRSQAI